MEYANIKNRTLSQNDIDQLTNMMKSEALPHVRNRAHAILLLFEDRNRVDVVAKIVRVHTNTVRNRAERWVAEGIDGLYDLEGRGDKPLCSRDEENIIVECLEKEPRAVRNLAVEVEKGAGQKAHVGPGG
jgi:transposase